MDDLISREKAIERIKKQCEHLHPESDSRDSIGWFAYHICIGILEVQPSAQKTGKWIHCKFPLGECSVCHKIINIQANEAVYCPCCGASMRSEKE